VIYSITKRGTKILKFFNVPTLISYNWWELIPVLRFSLFTTPLVGF
jgi:hypothetical protein